MRRFVKSFVSSCVDCAFNKRPAGKKEGEYHYSEMEPFPFKTVHVDHLGPFPKSSKGNEHILAIIDAFTKYAILRPVRTTSTRHTINVLNDISSTFGFPQRIVSDRGTSFTSREFEKYCTDNNIKHVLNAVRTPRANGQVERLNRTILSMLRPTTTNDRHWDNELRRIQWSINSASNKTTNRTPHELLFNFKPRDFLANKIIAVLQDEAPREEVDLDNIRDDAAQRINEQRHKSKQRFDKMHSKPHIYKTGDLVLAENEIQSTGTSRKLEPRYKGPFIVTKTLPNDRYVIEDLPASKRTTRHYTSVHSSDGLKPWCQLPDNESSEPTPDIVSEEEN